MHRILLRTLVIDVPSPLHERTRDFWTTALAAHPRRGEKFPEYHVLENSAAVGPVLVQDVGTAPARIHSTSSPTTWPRRWFGSSRPERSRSSGARTGS